DREQGGLAAARGPGDGHVLALLDAQVHAGQRVRLQLVGVEDLGHVLQIDERRRFSHGYSFTYWRRMLAAVSNADVSERITCWPGCRPSRTSVDETEARPMRTGTRVAVEPSGSRR